MYFHRLLLTKQNVADKCRRKFQQHVLRRPVYFSFDI